MTIPRIARTFGAALAGVTLISLVVAGCGGSTKSPPVPPSTIATTTTTAPILSNLRVLGVKPGVLQAPFYPMVTVSSVTCGTVTGGRFVRLDLPAGPAGTAAQSGVSQPSYVLLLPGKDELDDATGKTFYRETLGAPAPKTGDSIVLALVALNGSGNVMQINGDYTCPDTDVAYPGR